MRLSKFTDYAIRTCLYLAAHTERTVPISEIAGAHRLSQSNLMKVVNQLVDGGFVRSVRGRSGGVSLARPAEDIHMGAVARHMEGDGMLVDCSSCILLGACGAVPVLRDARAAFYETLDRVTLAEAVAAHPRTKGILRSARDRDAEPGERQAG